MEITPDNIIVNSCEYTPVYLFPNPSVTQAGSYIISQHSRDVSKPAIDNLKSFYESSGNLENGILSSPKKPRILRKQTPSVVGNNLKLASFLLPKTEIPVIRNESIQKEFVKKERIKKEYFPPVTQPVVFKPVVTTVSANVVNTVPRVEVESKIVKIGAIPLKRTTCGRTLPKSRPRDNTIFHQVITNPNPSKHTSVQLLKLGETYHSLNQLSDEQMKIVSKALNLFSDPEKIPKEPAYDPVTNTKFIYKVVSPRDLTVVGKNNVEIKHNNNIKKKPIKKVEKIKVEKIENEEEQSPSEPTVTRSGRTVKTPKPMCEDTPTKPRKKSGSVINCFQCSSEFCSLYRLQRHYEIYPTHIPAKIHSNLFHCLLAIMQSGSEEDQASTFIQQLEQLVEKLKTLLPCLLKKIDGREGKLCTINEDVGRLFGINSGMYNLNMDAVSCVKDKDGHCVHNPPAKNNHFSADMSKPSQLWLSKHNEELANNEAETDDCARINSVDKWPTATKRIWKLKQQKSQKSKAKRMRLASESNEQFIELGMDDVVTFSKPDGDIVTFIRPEDDVVTFSKTTDHIVTCNKTADNSVMFSKTADHVVTCNKTSDRLVAFSKTADRLVTFSKTADPVVTCNKTSDRIVTFSKTAEPVVASNKTSDRLVMFSQTADPVVTYNKTSDHLVTFSKTADPVVTCNKTSDHLVTFSKTADAVVTDEESAINVAQDSVSLLDNDSIQESHESNESTEQPVIENSSTSTEDQNKKCESAHMQFYSAHFDIRSSPIKPSALVRKFQIDPKKFTSYEVQIMRPLALDKPNGMANEIIQSDSDNLQLFRDNEIDKATVINTDINFGNDKGWTMSTVSSDEQSNDSFMKSNILFESALTPVKENNLIEPSLIHTKTEPNVLFDASSKTNNLIQPMIQTKSNNLIVPSLLNSNDGSNGFFVSSSRSDNLIAPTLIQTKANGFAEQSFLNSKDESNDFYIPSSRSESLIPPTLLQTKSSSLVDSSFLNSKDGSNGFFAPSSRSDSLIASPLIQTTPSSLVEPSLLISKDGSNGFFAPSSRSDSLIAPTLLQTKPSSLVEPSLLNSKDGSNGFFDQSSRSDNLIAPTLVQKSNSLIEQSLINLKNKSNGLFEPTPICVKSKSMIESPFNYLKDKSNSLFETALSHVKERSGDLFDTSVHHSNKNSLIGPSLIHVKENGFYDTVHRKHDVLFEQTLLHENDKTSVNIDESHDHLNTSNQGQSVLNFLESLNNELSYPESEIRNNSVDFQLDLFSFNSS